MDLQPTLSGQTLRLIPLDVSHQDDLVQAAADPLIWQLHPEPTRYLPDVFAKVFASGLQSGGAFLITDKHSGEVLGTTRFYEFNPQQSSVAIGYTFLVRSRWGGSSNSELKRLMLDHAFLSVDTVWFHVGEHNLRSRRAVEKLGARFSHLANESPTGAVRNTVFYRLDKAAWLTNDLR